MSEHFSEFWKLLIEYWFLPATILTTFLMAVFRTAKANGRVDYLEASMCSLFSMGIWFMLDWLGLPPEAGIGIGVFIAYIGTVRFSNWVRNKLNME